MRYNHDLGSNRIKIFLSSAMGDPIYEQQRQAIIAFFDRALPWFELFALENGSSPQPVQEHFLSHVADSDVILLVLQRELKRGVRMEYMRAKELAKRVFAFVHTGEMSHDLERFIKTDVQQNCTTSRFTTTRELINQIEAALLTDVARSYRLLYEENKLLLQQLEGAQTLSTGPSALGRPGGEPDWLT